MARKRCRGLLLRPANSSLQGISYARALPFCLLGLVPASPDLAFAQMKLPAKTAPGASETRYFTAIDGLMDGNADVMLKETRQGKTVTAAVLDVCYPAEKGSDRKDRFVANLAVSGQNLTGTTQSIGDKLPVTVKLSRKPTGDTFEFRGQITHRPDRDRGDLDRQFRSQREGISGQPDQRRRHHPGAEGFYRSFAGIVRRAGQARRRAGFPQKPEGRGRRGRAVAAFRSPAMRCAPASRPSTSRSIRSARRR